MWMSCLLGFLFTDIARKNYFDTSDLPCPWVMLESLFLCRLKIIHAELTEDVLRNKELQLQMVCFKLHTWWCFSSLLERISVEVSCCVLYSPVMAATMSTASPNACAGGSQCSYTAWAWLCSLPLVSHTWQTLLSGSIISHLIAFGEVGLCCDTASLRTK